MAGIGFNPTVPQGNLNRVATHLVVPTNPQLNATAGYMGKGLAVVTFEGPFTVQEETATGLVNSPKPFVMGQIVVNLLRTQVLCGLWIAQVQASTAIGAVVAYSDSGVFPPVTLNNASITEWEPGAFDGMDPVTKFTMKGIFYVNANLWAALTGPAGLLAV
jgi:hypothetical protein